MRDAFVGTLLEKARFDSRIVLITGDLGFGILEDFANQLPGQFINAGVAEQAMMSMAAGIAAHGKRVFVYSIANFPTFRCLEQIRNDVCSMNNPVVVVSVGAGFTYGSHGYSHHAIEDLSIMQSLPNMEIHSPGDPLEAVMATNHLCESSSPSYLRLGKNGESYFPQEVSDYAYNEPRRLIAGNDGSIIFTGSIGVNVIDAISTLNNENIYPSVYSVPNFQSLSADFILNMSKSGPILTVEENILNGGFGMLFAQKLIDIGTLNHSKFGAIAASRANISEVGSQSFLRNSNGLSPDSINQKFKMLLK